VITGQALKLADHENLSQKEAAEKMNVSRPTFTRIYDSARKKMAKALVECRSIFIEGGNVQFEDDWYHCLSCNSTFKLGGKNKPVVKCALCGSTNIEDVNLQIKDRVNDKLSELHKIKGDTGFCICVECGSKVSHQAGVPCRSVKCPECNNNMMRENSPHHLAYLRNSNCG